MRIDNERKTPGRMRGGCPEVCRAEGSDEEEQTRDQSTKFVQNMI